MPARLTVRPDVADRLSRMVQLPTVSAELETRGAAPFEAFAELIGELYPRVAAGLERERITDFGLLYRWRGTSDAAPVVLMAHYDVVPVDEHDEWTHPPFAGVVDAGRVYGRGTLDDKGPLAVILEAVENLLGAGFRPARDVYLSFGGNEESYGEAAARIADAFRERGITPWLVLDEGGAVVDAPLPFVRVPAAMVGVGEKGVMTVRMTARGDGGHASAPPKTTAAARIAGAVGRLSRHPFPVRMPASIRSMLAGFVPHTRGPAKLLLAALAALPPVTARVFVRMGGEPAALVRTTVAPTMLAGGTAPNVLPSQASATLNLRIALGETVDGAIGRLRRRVADPGIEFELLEGSEPSPESPVDTAQFAAIRDAVAVAYPEAITAPYVMMAATDSRHFHRFAPAVYRFAPLAMDARQRASIHGVDEYVEIDSLERGERFHRALLEALVA
ncbi:M20/M25/M40 family metallo-hydrolase [Agromyces archimandritae]|uniref:M20/M25/M40 family metallo-hydrolase n=1 Tax=Agromyces archimandritae TaxID=2781962 RepID=A0A975FM60_9MICO|nr:M20/M25/M40 family metallo-hydrolase [Agromyces archimandritae]QTX04033.1 M20/M25/M40 family metallo-hydrolase [Agromyces archimandritae]